MTAFIFGVLSGIVVAFGGRVAWEKYELFVRKKRLIHALMIDCIATIWKFHKVLPRLNKPLGSPDGNDEFARVSALPSGVIIDPPLAETKELIYLLSQEKARKILLLFDNWSRFRQFEERYVVIYAKLVDVVARCGYESDGLPYYEQLRNEYWQQVEGSRRIMCQIANEICAESCDLFEFATQNIGVTILNQDLKVISDGKWTSKEEMEQDMRRFRTLAA